MADRSPASSGSIEMDRFSAGVVDSTVPDHSTVPCSHCLQSIRRLYFIRRLFAKHPDSCPEHSAHPDPRELALKYRPLSDLKCRRSP